MKTHAGPNIYRDPELAKLEFEARGKKVGPWKEPDRTMGVERAERLRDNPMNPKGVYPNERN